MTTYNYNAGAQGNPLDALLGGSPLYGSTGFNIGAALGQARAGTIDPRLAALGYGPTSYDSTYQFNPSDPNIDPTTGYINLDGKTYTQLGSTGIGGPGQVIDPSKVIKNDKYGELTPVDNIKQFGSDIGGWGPFALAAIPAIGIAASALAGGSAAGAGGGAGAAGAAGGTAGGTSLGALGIDASPITVAPLGSVPAMASTDGILGSSGLLGSAGGLLGQAGSWAMAHPLQAAGLAQTAYGLLGGGRSSAPGGGGSSKGGGGGSLGTQGIQQKFYVNPVTQAQLQRYQGGLL